MVLVQPLPWAASSAPLQAVLQDIAQVKKSVHARGRDATSQTVRDYFKSAGSEILEARGFSFRERQHFQEVKQALERVKHGVWWVQTSLLLNLGALFGLVRWSPIRVVALMGRSARMASLILGLTVLLGLLGLAFGFDQGFVTLHRIVFADVNWILPPDALTIALFPRSFFFAGAQFYGLWIALTAIALSDVSWIVTKLTRSPDASETRQGGIVSD